LTRERGSDVVHHDLSARAGSRRAEA
jgi:hypothetical protein